MMRSVILFLLCLFFASQSHAELNKYFKTFRTNLLPYQGFPIDPVPPPLLVVKEKSLIYTDTDGNGRLDAGEIATIELVIVNMGKGPANDLKMVSQLTGTIQDITLISPNIPTIRAGKEQIITTIIRAGMNVQTGKVLARLTVKEPNGMDSRPVEIEFSTLAFQPPNVVAEDGIFSSGSRPSLMTNYPANLEVLVQNTGTGNAEEITVEVKLPEHVISLDQRHLPIARLRPGESVRLNTGFIVTTSYTAQEVPIKIVIHEKHGRYGSANIFSAHLDQPLTTRVIVEAAPLKPTPVIPASLHSDVDQDIPMSNNRYINRYALVIGNEDYQRFQTGLQSDQNVAFARNDAIIFKEYLVKSFGFPEKQVFLLIDATRGQVSREIERIIALAKLSPGAELVFYYAGHGLPDLETRQGYLIPVDVTAADLKDGIRLGELYGKLAASKAAKVTVFLDACFSGGGRGENGLLAARTVKIKPKGDVVEGNVVVFAATSDEEVSLPYTKQSHGLFTYYLLRKLKDTKGNITMKDLVDYLVSEVPKASLLENGMKQTPQVLVAPDLGDAWRNWKF